MDLKGITWVLRKCLKLYFEFFLFFFSLYSFCIQIQPLFLVPPHTQPFSTLWIFFFWRWGLTIKLWLTLTSLYRLGWPPTQWSTCFCFHSTGIKSFYAELCVYVGGLFCFVLVCFLFICFVLVWFLRQWPLLCSSGWHEICYVPLAGLESLALLSSTSLVSGPVKSRSLIHSKEPIWRGADAGILRARHPE